ncbi:MAG: rubrerythrin family protein [Mycoplasmataceae bacterium]|nr:rubrerythrin family protein [Mycoplasmataceae bacterium]
MENIKQKSIKGTQTEKNLQIAFAGESQARNKYTYYASQAKKDGYVLIQKIFEETAGNEKEHAELWFKELKGGKMPTTLVNLLDAAAGEHEEWTKMYKEMAKTARAEGFIEIATKMEGVAAIEATHEKRYLDLASAIKSGKFFARDKAISWKCQNCGHTHVGTTAPKLCPVCSHPQSYFEQAPTKNY